MVFTVLAISNVGVTASDRGQILIMDEESQHPAAPSPTEENVVEIEREDSKSPIQEVEEEPFVKIELVQGLKELNEAMKRGELKEIRSCYTNLTKTFPTAVIHKQIPIVPF